MNVIIKALEKYAKMKKLGKISNTKSNIHIESNETIAEAQSNNEKHRPISVSLIEDSGWTLFQNPSKWCYNQICGWSPDKNGKYHGIWNRLHHAEFKKLFTGNNLDIDEVESAISTIAFVSNLIY